LARELARCELPGIAVRPIWFVPTFDKWRGQRCGGVALHVTSARAVRSVATTLYLLSAVHKLYPGDFAWLPPPYEYETMKPPIDILFGSPRLRERLEDALPITPHEIGELTAFDQADWRRRTASCRLY
jgi:uncharacterized protein YbbC (DUF1343 family)